MRGAEIREKLRASYLSPAALQNEIRAGMLPDNPIGAGRRLVRDLLTATGEALWWERHGESVPPLHPDRPPHQALACDGSVSAHQNHS
jgi:hypothetical protein